MRAHTHAVFPCLRTDLHIRGATAHVSDSAVLLVHCHLLHPVSPSSPFPHILSLCRPPSCSLVRAVQDEQQVPSSCKQIQTIYINKQPSHRHEQPREIHIQHTHKYITPMHVHTCTKSIQKCTALTGYVFVSSNHRDTATLQVCNNTYTQNIHTNIQHPRIGFKIGVQIPGIHRNT